ncbi:uncharacterized protein EAE97_004474 [Botrytis byssoidea]|uniref:Uncharacterized protein n=1 Tax=Botrytis byssoidea TaxID=139641 RepID=A0A9P5M6L9_9HELO|nr:uncharacterized protein EAE97_004474 [Botrytis byssoidea]KAF7947225.1 hypothetical protein EAE97_004474 [Botrytis byssoidea]
MNVSPLFGQHQSLWTVFLLRTAIDKLARKNYNIARARPGESKQCLYFRLEALQQELTQEQLASIIAEFRACQYGPADVGCAPQQECNPQGQQQQPPPKNAEIGARNDEAQDDDSRDRMLRLELMFEDFQEHALVQETRIERLVNRNTELQAQYNESQNLVTELRMQSDNSETRVTELEANVTRQNARLARQRVQRRIRSNRKRARLRRAGRRLRRQSQRLFDAAQDVHGLADGWRWI